jgi:hypothetical protein
MVKEYRQVLRSFDGEGTSYAKGDVVETSSWKNVSKLIATRYLSSFTVKESLKTSEPAKVEKLEEVPSVEEPKKAPAKKTSAPKKVADSAKSAE